MMIVTQDQLDAPIAVLESFGLDLRIVNMLERRFGAVRIRDLVDVTRRDLEREKGVGEGMIQQLERVLGEFFGEAEKEEAQEEE